LGIIKRRQLNEIGTWEWDFYTDKVHVKHDPVIIVEKAGWIRSVGIYQPATGKVYIPLKEPIVAIPQTATLWITPDGKLDGNDRACDKVRHSYSSHAT